MSQSSQRGVSNRSPVSTRQLAELAETVHRQYALLPSSACATLARRARRLAESVLAPPSTSASAFLWIDEVHQALSRSLVVATRLRKHSQPRSLFRTIVSSCAPRSLLSPKSKDLQTVNSISRTVAEWLSAFSALHQPPDNELVLDLDEASDTSTDITPIPALPSRYVPIHTLFFDELKTSLLRIAATESKTGVICVSGPTGLGKSVLVNSLIHDATLSETFSDGMSWVQLGPSFCDEHFVRDVAIMCQTVLGDHVADEVGGVHDFPSLARLAENHALHESCSLVIVDDVCDSPGSRECLAAIIDMFCADRHGSKAAIIFTTNCDPAAVCSSRALVFPLTHLSPLGDDARAVFDSWASLSPLNSRYHHRSRGHIVQACGGLPVALAIAGASLRKSNFNWESQTAALDASANGGLFVGCDGESAAFLLLHWIVKQRSASLGEWLKRMSIVPFGTWIPASALSRLWSVDDATARVTIKQLERLALSSLETRNMSELGLQLHAVVHEYCVQLASAAVERGAVDSDQRASSFHFDLVENYAVHASLPFADSFNRCRSWWLLPNDNYMSTYLPWHLINSGLFAELTYLVCDFRWIFKRFMSSGPNGIRSDLDLLVQFGQDLGDRHLLERVALAIAEFQDRIVDESQLALQLCFKLSCHVADENPFARRIVSSVRRHAKRPWLRPLRGKLGSTAFESTHKDASDQNILVERVDAYGSGANAFAVSIGQDGGMIAWSLNPGTWGRRLCSLGDGYCHSVAVAISEDYVVSGGKDGVLRLWSLQNGECLRRIKASRRSLTALATARMSSSRKKMVGARLIVACGSTDGSVFVCDMNNDSEWQRQCFGHMDEVTGICVLPHQRRIVTGSFDGFAYIWSLDSGKRVPLNGHKDRVSQLVALDGGDKVASSCHGGHAYIWSSSSGALLWSKEVGHEFVSPKSLERFIRLNTEKIDFSLQPFSSGECNRFPYFCSRGLSPNELVIVSTDGSNSVMGSGIFDSCITGITEVWARDSRGSDCMIVVVGLESGCLLFLEVVTSFVAFPTSEDGSSPRAVRDSF